ncbi:MAG: Do family serine endopeptidase [Halothiobacillaceae bacterium]|nr:Do family serine endopeptidase [Halothiobacillaceae bacterium]
MILRFLLSALPARLPASFKKLRVVPFFAVLLAFIVGLNLTACGDQKSTAQVTGLPDFSALVAANNDSVVNITAIAPLAALPDASATEATPSTRDDLLNQFFNKFFGFNGAPDGAESPLDNGAETSPEQPDTNSGSGFILSQDGYILTNQHVIDGATSVFVRLADGRELKAQVKGSDQAGDIALLKIDADHLKPVVIGNSDGVKPGQWAVAIGSPFGFDHSVTAGIISAKGRALPGEADQRYVPFLQTDVAINPGSSGGPLFNTQGQVIGINAQILTESGGYNGLSFAIPINYAMQVVDQLKKSGVVERGFLGVQIQSLDRSMAQAMGMDRPQGALITGFVAGSPAAQSDLQPGDVITRANGHVITESSDLPQTIGVLPPGALVKLTVLTQGKPHTVDVQLGVLPKYTPTQIQAMKSHDLIVDNYGLLLTDEAGQIRIKAVEPQGPADAAGLKAQDILLSLNRQPLDSLTAAESAFKMAEKDKPNAVLIRRGDTQHFLALSLQPD